jgi:hypothetical protein
VNVNHRRFIVKRKLLIAVAILLALNSCASTVKELRAISYNATNIEVRRTLEDIQYRAQQASFRGENSVMARYVLNKEEALAVKKKIRDIDWRFRVNMEYTDHFTTYYITWRK